VLGTFLVLTLAVIVVYGRSIRAPFIFDDTPAIVQNPSITRLWPLIGDVSMPGPLNAPLLAPTARRPVVNLSFALNYRVGGLDPVGYHVVNLVLHFLCATVLAALVRRTLLLPYFQGAFDRSAGLLAAVVALIWVVHPLNTETVVYVTQRTELLAALFYLTTLWAASRSWTADSRESALGWAGVAIAACWLGIASKEVVASAPVAVWLYQRTFLAESSTPQRRAWAFYVALALGWIGAALSAVIAAGSGALADDRHRVSFPVWWVTQAKSVLLYLKLTLWPWPLSIHYTSSYLSTFAAAWPWVLGAMAAAAAAIALVWRRPAARFVVVVVVMTLAPTLVVPLPKMVAAERRMYLPLAGLITLAVVAGYRFLCDRKDVRRAWLAAGVAATSILVLGAVSVRRLEAYETAVTIWEDNVLRQPDDAMSHYNLGVALLDERRFEEAMQSFERTLVLEPDHTMALDNLGSALNSLGRPQDAIAPLEKALQIDPADAFAHNNLGSALLRLGRPQDAMPHVRRALELTSVAPNSVIYLNLGRALLESGRAPEALDPLERAVQLAPTDANAHYSLGTGLLHVGRADDAIVHFERALEIEPDDAGAHGNLASALVRTGRPERAVVHYERVLASEPANAPAHNNLAIALLQLGRTAEGVEHLEQALQLKPDYASAHDNLGRALLAEGRAADAAQHFEQAARLDPQNAEARLSGAIAYARSGHRSEALAMANDGLAIARSRGDAALAAQLSEWLESAAREGEREAQAEGR
jgi:protein O-mannosyl-transferase